MTAALHAAEAGPAGAVAVSGLSKAFGATRALSDVSLSVAAGSVHCLLGENGAGKSTLGKIIAGLYRPDRGEIRIGGTPVRLDSVAEARRLGISIVFQELSLAPDLTVQENICLGTEPGRLSLRPLPVRSETQSCRDLLTELGLDIAPQHRCGQLSPPQQQLVEIAKALATGPRIVVFDEPTSMLDSEHKQRLLGIVRRLRARGLAIIYITHQVDEVMAIADQVSVLRDGRLVTSCAVTAALDADRLVEILAGKRVARPARRVGAPNRPVVLALAGLPSRTGAASDIVIYQGEIVALYGVAGCGVELLAQGVVGLTELPHGVEMELLGRPCRPGDPAAAARCGIAYLPTGRAANGILPTRSIRENLMVSQLGRLARFGTLFGRAERAVADRQLHELGTRFASASDRITSLSGGNQQKVLLGRALGRSGCLVVLEDPTAGVDIAAKDEIHRLIRDRAASGTAFLLVSSDLDESIALADTLYTLFGGRLAGRHDGPVPADEPAIVAEILGTEASAPAGDAHA